jgi:uncharacterized cupredoxin-like copper-binding protein
LKVSRRSTVLRGAGLAAILAAALLAGAGSAVASGWLDDQGAGTPPPRTVTIRIHFSRFDQDVVDVAPGQTIRFVVVNTDPIDHEFIVGDRGIQLAHERGTEAHHPPRPGEISVPAGETVETTMTVAASGEPLLFGCHLPGHYAFGMRGEIRVG